MSAYRGGYTGRFLRVDLDAGAVTIEPTPDVSRWLGPRGWNAWIGWSEVPAGVGAFDAANRLVFSVGPLVGTSAPTSGRTTISTLMPRGYPQTMWSTATMGGYWGPELKYAGYDGIVIHGRAASPCYLLIEDGEVRLEDATDLWGRGVYETERTLKARHGDSCQIAAIGPAGENRVRYASIIHRLTNAVGNGGFGGVMGAKRLKAIAVRGTRGVPIADPEGFLEATRGVHALAISGISRIGRPESGYPNVACTHACSVRCGARMRRTGDTAPAGVDLNMTKCVDGSWIGGSHLEYRGTSLHGRTLYVPRPPGLGEIGLDLANLANDLGLTTWAYDTWYRYLGALGELGIHEVLGEAVRLDDPAWWREWLLKVAERRGTGDEYAEGLARFYERHSIGPDYVAEFIESAGSRGHGWHRDGRAMEPHPSPFWEYSALLYAVSTRDVTPSTHDFFFLNELYGYPQTPKTGEEIPEALQALSQRLYGSRRAVWPGDEHIEHVTALHQHRAVIKDSMAVCDWVFPIMRRNYATQEAFEAALRAGEPLYGDMDAEGALYRAATGIPLDTASMESPIAERIVNLERCLEVRNHGRSRTEDEVVIPHYQWPEKTDGTHLSADAAEFRALLDRYYALRGWDRETGWPTPERLERLGLPEAAREMAGLFAERAEGTPV